MARRAPDNLQSPALHWTRLHGTRSPASRSSPPRSSACHLGVLADVERLARSIPPRGNRCASRETRGLHPWVATVWPRPASGCLGPPSLRAPVQCVWRSLLLAPVDSALPTGGDHRWRRCPPGAGTSRIGRVCVCVCVCAAIHACSQECLAVRAVSVLLRLLLLSFRVLKQGLLACVSFLRAPTFWRT